MPKSTRQRAYPQGTNARHFGYSRPTVYRWLGRYDRFRLETLEDRPSHPVRRRRPTWALAELTAVRRLRERYPRWGKDKLAVLLRREGIVLSVSMVGRILERLRRTGDCPTGSGSSSRPATSCRAGWNVGRARLGRGRQRRFDDVQ